MRIHIFWGGEDSEKVHFLFFDIFKIWAPGGAVLFVYFFVFARFDDVPSRFDDFFLFEMKKLH